MKHAPETRKLLRDLAKELESAGASLGQKLEWSAADQVVLDQISTVLDRKAELMALYEQVEDVKDKVRLSGEVRLLEQAAARLIRAIKTDLPAPTSIRSVKARHAANTRWDRERRA